MSQQTEQRDLIFFVHILKTGGSSLNTMVRPLFPVEAVYPCALKRPGRRTNPGQGLRGWRMAYVAIPFLRMFDESRRRRFRFVAGHLPYCVAELFEQPVRCISFFRDPVSRTISHLKQARTLQPRYKGWPLDRLYAHDTFHEQFIANLQTRHFAHEMSDELTSVFVPKRLTPGDIERAKQRVAGLEFIGILEDYEASISLLKRQLGLPITNVVNRRVPYDDCDVPADLPARIAEDNAIDMELYEFVKSLYYGRKHQALPSAA
jgi:hypothetical protein